MLWSCDSHYPLSFPSLLFLLYPLRSLPDVVPPNLLNAALPFTGPTSVRSHPAPEAPGNSIGLEAIIRKALMGKYDDQSEERSPSNAANQMGSSGPAAMSVADGRAEDCFSQGATFVLLYSAMHLILFP